MQFISRRIPASHRLSLEAVAHHLTDARPVFPAGERTIPFPLRSIQL